MHDETQHSAPEAPAAAPVTPPRTAGAGGDPTLAAPDEQIMIGHLPTGQVDPDTAERVTIPVAFALARRKHNHLALTMSLGDESRGIEAQLLAAETNLVRVCLRRVGDQDVDAEQLRGDRLYRYLEPKHEQMIREAIQRLTNATEGDAAAAAARVVSTFDGQRHLRQLDYDLDGDRHSVVFTPMTTDLLGRTREAARQFEGMGTMIVDLEANLNVLRFCVREFDGQAMTFDQLRGHRIDHVIPPRWQSLLLMVINRMSTPKASERKDFFASLASG